MARPVDESADPLHPSYVRADLVRLDENERTACAGTGPGTDTDPDDRPYREAESEPCVSRAKWGRDLNRSGLNPDAGLEPLCDRHAAEHVERWYVIELLRSEQISELLDLVTRPED